ncbi:major facilitator superfamily domain-containing protein [Colletotrichum acutatum]|uniref:Major facilitator superfamily domain-containing protein n=1 Tax=Glomerella acutata TaxID=27357 RepID=A0AAD8XIA4_GLOAC|nr:major facilitator superfamily domain-containing protein [Colletotrichum acutatum]KAK1724410.1 major facilitator superfamily domain-containing protein [Colletotrichum acutatum]
MGVQDDLQNVVDWTDEYDFGNPRNFSPVTKWGTTVHYGLVTFIVTFASSIFSTATEVTSELFGVSKDVMHLATALNVLGFAFGPLVFGPLSELYGRKTPLLLGLLVFCVFNIPIAVATNVETILICRFIVGFGGAAPLAIVGGALVDLFLPIERGIAVCIFAGATFMGSIFGPIVGGFVTESHLGWRWTAWLTLIPGAVLWAILLLFIPETYGPVILQRRARELRFETGNWALHAAIEEHRLELSDIAQRYLVRPIAMLCREPILALVTVYMSLIYGILYLFFEAYPISFSVKRGWSLGVGTLPFLSLGLGIVLGGVVVLLHLKYRYAKIYKADGKVPPEERLIPMIFGAVSLPIGMFWFAWTSDPDIHWASQVLAGIPTGIGIMTIFIQGLVYLIDTYAQLSNSAIAANVFLRSWVGAGFTMFATSMYNKLGVAWASSLLGFICVSLIPVPVLFFKYGEVIRKKSVYAPFTD